MKSKTDNQTILSSSEKARDLSIEELSQSVRVKNILTNYGFFKIGDFCGSSRDQCKRALMKLRYFVASRRQSELLSLLDELERLRVWDNGMNGDSVEPT